jgi:hypothetical protein
MARKMYLNVNLKLIVEADEELSIDNVMDTLNFFVEEENENVSVIDSQIENFNLTDSK